MTAILKSNFQYLEKIKKNNNRDWFNANKETYLEQHEQIISFADSVLVEMQKHDDIETVSGKKSLHRIYRDVRFSKNKLPYKNHWGGGFKRATSHLRGGYYYHIEPGNSFVGGGFWSPNSGDMKLIRDEIDHSHKELSSILNSKQIKDTFSNLLGEQLKTSPKGFSVDHPAIDLLRYKQFILKKDFTDEEVFDPSFHKEISNTFKKMRPFFDFMSAALTTDANGVPIY